jgi:hypothetical protein
MREEFGYADFTADERELIFGKNIAGLYGIDMNAKRNEIPADLLSNLKSAYIDEGADPAHTQYGWVAV